MGSGADIERRTPNVELRTSNFEGGGRATGSKAMTVGAAVIIFRKFGTARLPIFSNGELCAWIGGVNG